MTVAKIDRSNGLPPTRYLTCMRLTPKELKRWDHASGLTEAIFCDNPDRGWQWNHHFDHYLYELRLEYADDNTVMQNLEDYLLDENIIHDTIERWGEYKRFAFFANETILVKLKLIFGTLMDGKTTAVEPAHWQHFVTTTGEVRAYFMRQEAMRKRAIA